MQMLKSRQARGHAAGIYSDNTLDGPEIGTLVVVVDRAKNLPNRRTMGKQDPYVAMRLAKEARKTQTDRRGGQTPKWDDELRFIVHDSPDYYKLKCSIFNDDKKTELISEVWIDLVDVIKLGGGQSDQWHTLNFKGKYAGEIRIEITFYDSRDKPQEKRVKEPRPQSTITGLDTPQPGPKSLGPREVRRRPLPVSPADPTPPPALVSYEEPTQPQIYEDGVDDYEQEQIYQPLQQQIHAPTPTRPRQRSQGPQPVYDPYEQRPDYMSQYPQHGNETFESPQFTQQYNLQHSNTQQPSEQQFEQQRYQDCADQPMQYNYAQQETSSNAYTNDSWQQTSQLSHVHSEPNTPYEKPVYRPAPIASHSDSQLMQYEDSSEARYHEPVNSRQRDFGFEPQEEQAPPPLPPKHRDQMPKRSRNEFPPSAYAPQPLRFGGKRSSIHDRSPLQSLEDGYSSEQELLPHPSSVYGQQQRHSMIDINQQPQTFQSSPRPQRSHQDLQPYVTDGDTPPRRQENRRKTSYEIRNHIAPQQQFVEEPQLMEEHYASRPGSSRAYPADATPNSSFSSVSRKAVGASPKKLSGVPFGPDAYDVLNPSSSPVTNDGTAYQTPEQAKESQRLKEVEKIRDLGPIIGNDGREIDPSDHLPSDTWAPEPERKHRQPEHVVHIRSKNDRPSGARGSPLVIRHNGSSYSNQSSPSPATPQSTGSAPGRTPNGFLGGRNRLQKPMPGNARALPVQPSSSPAAPPSMVPSTSPQDVTMDQRPRPRSRHPSYENRGPSHLTRPPLTEYQVPVGNNQPRGSYDTPPRQKALMYHPHETTPSKAPQNSYSYPSPMPSSRRQSYDNRQHEARGHRDSYDNRSDHSFENYPEQIPQQRQEKHFDDPLAAELSLIDIGPSRHSYHQGSMGRSMQRRW